MNDPEVRELSIAFTASVRIARLLAVELNQTVEALQAHLRRLPYCRSLEESPDDERR